MHLFLSIDYSVYRFFLHVSKIHRYGIRKTTSEIEWFDAEKLKECTQVCFITLLHKNDCKTWLAKIDSGILIAPLSIQSSFN